MNAPNSLSPDELEERAAIAFLEQFVTDRAAGRPCDLTAYLGDFERFQRRIAREWLLAIGALVPPAAANPAPAAAADRIGPYRLVRELGRGGQGVVYLAEDPRLGRLVALKVLARDLDSVAGPAQMRLQREADAIARLDHPGIATIYETGNDAGVAWIAMRYVSGGSVQQAIAARLAAGLGPPVAREEVQAAARLVQRAARALEAAHGAGILHRDVKPANLLLAADDQPVLVDFGLASAAEGRTPTITLPGAVFGTLCYLPPERLAGAAADARADVHALAAVLFELLTLERPYNAATTAGELHAIAHGPLPDVRSGNPAIPRDLALIVATALARVPEQRYQTAEAFGADLGRFLAHEPIHARPAGPFVRLLRWTQRSPALAASLLLLALVLTGGLGATTWLWRESARSLASVNRLADLKLSRELSARTASLWPARPEQVPAMNAWQADLAALRGRLDLHRRHLAGLPPGGTDPTMDWQRGQLEELLAEHVALDQQEPLVSQRLGFASTLRQRSIDAVAGEWAAVASRMAAGSLYGKLSLAPQLGLVPLGPDPASGREEFAHLASGTVPTRGADGKLRLVGESAIVLVLVPGGEAVLGAEAKAPASGQPANVDASAAAALGPCYTVTLEPFFLSKFEMTQEQWQRHTGRNPSAYHVGGDVAEVQSPRHPVEVVAWLAADRVLRELDLQLPTEAQWEWAYRAGTQTRYPSGDDEHSLDGRENLADRTAQRSGQTRWRFIDWLDDGHMVHAPVGSFLANPFGLHDMGGNLKEWCRDTWEDYPDCAPRPGDGLRLGTHSALRVLRGGCFSSHLDEPRSASRGGTDQSTSGAEAGIRPGRRVER